MYRLAHRANANTSEFLSASGSNSIVGLKGGNMKHSVTTPCATAVSLFRGLYGRVARDLGIDVSYISRIARGERKSEVAEKALNREFRRVLALVRNSSAPSDKNRSRQTRKKVRQKRY
jgi:hypothetical protein